MDSTMADPKGLVRESYAIEGITAGECRTIFLDWALSLAPGVEPKAAMQALITQYGAGRPEHPMTATLTDGLAATPEAKRRGGRAGRLGYDPAG
jgi:hypothetical protein